MLEHTLNVLADGRPVERRTITTGTAFLSVKETAELINKEYGDGENAFDRCMEVTKRSRDYFKEAMRREDYYRNSMLLMGVDELLTNGYLAIDDFKDCRLEIQEKVRQWTRSDD